MGNEVPTGEGIEQGLGTKGFCPEQGLVPGREAEDAAQLRPKAGGQWGGAGLILSCFSGVRIHWDVSLTFLCPGKTLGTGCTSH